MKPDRSEGIAEGRYNALDADRKGHLDRCRECSAVTIPSLLPKEGYTQNDQLPTPYQGLGARAVNNLASKLLITLFPPNSPFFKMEPDPMVIEQLQEEMGKENFKTLVNSKLRLVETMVVKFIEAIALRLVAFKALRLLVVTGNALLEVSTDTGKVILHRIDKFVLQRSPAGDVIEIIIRQDICASEVPDYISTAVKSEDLKNEKGIERKDIGLFTHIKFSKASKKWNTYQEVLGVRVKDSEGEFPEDKLPYIPLAWTLSEGEDYGRGHVDEYLGDFVSYDALSQSLLEGAAAAARVLYLVNPTGMTNADDIIDAPNGGSAVGREEDVSVLQLQKYHDFKIAYEQSLEIKERLSRAFILNESIQRNAERVTAEEIRYMAQELENALGGVFSVLGQELQYPIATRLFDFMADKGKLPTLPPNMNLTIITGFEALGRGHDLDKLRMLKAELVEFGPEAVNTWINISDYAQRTCNALGIDPDGLVNSQEKVTAQIQKQQQQQAALQLAGTGAATEIVKGMGNNGGPT